MTIAPFLAARPVPPLSGLPSDRFLFAGFLSAKPGERKTTLEEVKGVGASLIFFESAQRLAESLTAMAQVLGDRPAVMARELTKLHEEVRRGSLMELAAHYENAGAPPLFYQVDLGTSAYIDRVQLLRRTDADQGVFGNMRLSILQTNHTLCIPMFFLCG